MAQFKLPKNSQIKPGRRFAAPAGGAAALATKRVEFVSGNDASARWSVGPLAIAEIFAAYDGSVA